MKKKIEKILKSVKEKLPNLKKEKNKETQKEQIENKKFYITYELRVIINSILCFVSFILCLLFIILSLKINVDTNLRYYQTSNLDYKVNLKNNEFFDENSLNKNMQYIASLVDSVDVDFNYNFKTSEALDYTYSYAVNAEVKISDSSTNNIIFSRKESLLDEKKVDMNSSSGFPLRQQIKIDYNKFNDIAKKFKSEYAITAKSDLIVTMTIKVSDKAGKEIKNLNANNTMSITIPLAEQMININMDYKEINNSDTFVAHTNFKINNYVTFVFGIIFGLGSIILLILLLKLITRLFKKKTVYDKTLSRILREYDRVIVESRKDNIDINKDIIDVKSFNELLDARDNLEKPIIYTEVHKGQKCVFIVKNNYEIYRYVMKAVDLENSINNKKL